MKKTDIINGISYLEIPEENLRILCGCPENSIKFIMKKGLTYQVEINGYKLVSGPNSILLNDFSVLNSHYLNFSEFPVLHHQFFQGAAFNGSNEKFTLIGQEHIVDKQYNYIRRGMQGLTTTNEILEAGVEPIIAEKILSIGNYHKNYKNEFNIIDKVYIKGKTKIKGELYLERIALNVFRFHYLDETIDIDLNLNPRSKGVGLPYNISNKYVDFDEFSITTIGDGNGWNPMEPCMNSLISCKGKRFLVDSGPGSLDLIKNLGVSSSEVEGVFVTHSHDDHFAGILSLLNSDKKIKFFATPLVIISVQKKFLSLLDITLSELKKYFDFIELKEGLWTDIGEMEVKPYYSFHTIETNVFYFRVKDSLNKYKSYGHITDIISKKDLTSMLHNDKSGIIKKDWTDIWFSHYLEKCDLKRIDAGGGVVHGDSHDFKDDISNKIILSHLNHKIDTSENKHFTSPTSFGHTEILLKTDINYKSKIAASILKEIALISGQDQILFSDNDIILTEPNTLLSEIGDNFEYIYMVISGIVYGNSRKYIQGDFLYTFNNEKKSKLQIKTETYCNLLRIKKKIFFKYIKNIHISNNFKYLHDCTYFTYGFSFIKLLELSNIMKKNKLKKGNELNLSENNYFFIIEGIIDVKISGKLFKTLRKNDLSVFPLNDQFVTFDIKENSTILMFTNKDILKFTSVLWSVFEENKKIETIVETGFI